MKSRPTARPRLQLERLEDRSLLSATPTIELAWTPNDPLYRNQYGMNNTGQSGGVIDADIDAPEAWGVVTSSPIPVGIVDTGIDFTHPDLYRNIWINQTEIPASRRANLVDVNRDGRITLFDLNDPINQGVGKIMDINKNGYIDAWDLLQPMVKDAQGRDTGYGGWADGVDGGNNGYTDDIVGWNFVNNTNNPLDDHGHGTHIAGTIGAMGNNGVGIAGVNWNAQMMALKTFDSKGASDMRWVAAAIDYASGNGARVINASWTITSPSTTLENALVRARNRGTLVVAAAGNAGVNIDARPTYPGSYALDNLLIVAATDDRNNLASYSNFSSRSVDLAAPGSNIYSTNLNKSYGNRTGTSMATPFVAGAAALVWALRPEWTYQQLVNQLLNTVKPLSSLNGKVASGGRLSVGNAVRNLPPRGTSPKPFKPATLAEVTGGTGGTAHLSEIGAFSGLASTLQAPPREPDAPQPPAVGHVSPQTGRAPVPVDVLFAAVGRKKGPAWLTAAADGGTEL